MNYLDILIQVVVLAAFGIIVYAKATRKSISEVFREISMLVRGIKKRKEEGGSAQQLINEIGGMGNQKWNL